MVEPEILGPQDLSTDELRYLAFERGELSWMLHPHQLERIYKPYRAWEPVALAPAAPGEKQGQARVFVLDASRQVGKTYGVSLIKCEDCQRDPGSRHTYATAHAKDITEIVIPQVETIYADAPDEFRPQYQSSKSGMREGFYWPNGSVLRLVGLDKNPKGLRGRTSDGMAISEAAFVRNLRKTVGSVIYPQFQHRPNARLILESSAPEDPDHDFDEVFVPDAKRRGAYVFLTIHDNTALSDETKREVLDAAESINHADMEREYLGIRSRDFSNVVFPEFSKDQHVHEVEIPKHGYALVAADPGFRHLFGLCFGIYDFDRQKLIIQSSAALSNASTLRAAAVTAAHEYALWGTWPPHRMRTIPLESTADAVGWKDLLKRDPHESKAQILFELAHEPVEKRPDYERRPGQFITNDIPEHVTFYDQKRYRPNPWARVSDVDLRMIRDIDESFDLRFDATTKDELRVMVALVRNWLAAGRIEFLPSAGPVIDHVNGAKWARDRRKFDEHLVHGHYDCASTLVYMVRKAQLIEFSRPHPPEHLTKEFPAGSVVVERMPWQPKMPHELEIERVRQHAHGSYGRGRMRY